MSDGKSFIEEYLDRYERPSDTFEVQTIKGDIFIFSVYSDPEALQFEIKEIKEAGPSPQMMEYWPKDGNGLGIVASLFKTCIGVKFLTKVEVCGADEKRYYNDFPSPTMLDWLMCRAKNRLAFDEIASNWAANQYGAQIKYEVKVVEALGED